MPYRTFTRTWWLDRACTRPGAGHKHYSGQIYDTEEQARAACAEENDRQGKLPGGNKQPGARGRGPYGRAMEYERTS